MTQHPGEHDADPYDQAYPYALDAVSEQERRDIDAWLRQSSTADRRAFEEVVHRVRETMSAAAAATETPAPPQLRNRLLAALDEQTQDLSPDGPPQRSAPLRRRFRWLVLAGAAAGFTALATTGLIITQLADAPQTGLAHREIGRHLAW